MSQPMGLDVRWPLGLLFTLIGLLLAGYGLIYDDRVPVPGGQDMTGQPMSGLHINVWWGMVLFVFGVSVLWLARRAARSGALGR
jgi:hypothetical protein